MSSNSKGKGVDRTSPWSEWQWDAQRGFFWASRYNSAGDVEYDYQYPPPPAASTSHQATPRSPGDAASWSTNSSPTTSHRDTQEARSSSGVGRSSSDVSRTSEFQTTNYAPQDTHYTTAAANETHSSAGSATSPVRYSIQPFSPQSSSVHSSSYQSSGYSNTGSTSFYSNVNKPYDTAGTVTTALGNLSIGTLPATIPEQEPYGSQVSSGYIKRSPNSPDKEKLDPRYRVISDKDQKKFWKVGRVFLMLWTEPASGSASTRNGTHYSTVWLDQGAYSEIRRFVVIKEGYGNSICSPIHTYNGQATLKPNLPERQQHAIIYSSAQCPPEHSYTAANGTLVKENLSKDPIKVRREQNGPEGDLGAFSRLNYSKIYTVENYVRVLNIGMVERDWLPTLHANSYVRPSDTPIEKPTKYPSSTSSDKDKKSKGHRKRH